MSVEFKILETLGVVYVKYDGFADLASTFASAQACTTHPNFRPWFTHFFDLGGATGYEKDFTRFFALQAQLADVYLKDGEEHLAVFFAPDGPPREMAEMARKSWDGVSQMVVRILDEKERALAVLGLDATDLERHLSIA